jgi:hypothetical protein
MKDYVVLKKPQEQADRLLPPRTLILDFTPDGALRTVSRTKLMFLHAHREASVLTSEIPEESGQFRFLRPTSLDSTSLPNIKISIPLHSSSRSFIPLPHFIRSRRPTLLLSPSLVFSPLCSS